jgi:hypothetical protein
MTANNPPALAFNSGYAFQIDGDTNPTPSQIKILQSASLDLKSTTKQLFGQNIFPVAVGRSQIKCDGKLKFADYQPRMIRDFVGAPNNSLMTAGQTLVNVNEAHSVPAPSGPYTVTVTNSATFVLDLGVTYSATGIPLTNVASGPTVGQYSYSAGVYTFAAADDSVAVLISYTSTLASSGDSVLISNTAAGAANSFETVFGATYNSLQTNFLLYACIPTDFKLADFKIGDFSMPELGYEAVVNSAGNLGICSLPVTS